MPGHLTHNKSHLDVYKLLAPQMQKKYAQAWEEYKIFAQGHDFLLLYMFLHLPKYPKVHAKLKIIEDDIQGFAVHYVHALQKSSKSDEAVMFLYGYLVHHFLDAKLHPLVVHMTGDLENSKDASALHLLVENMIDAHMLKKDGIDPKKFIIHSIVTSKKAMAAETRAILDYSFKEAYNLDGFSELFCEYNKTARSFMKTLRHDPRGIKRILFRPLDFLLMGLFKPSILPFHFDGTECLGYLNLENKPWAFPADAARVSTQSLDELFDEAVGEIAQMLSLLDEAIANDATDEDIRSIIPNISSIHGI